MFDSILNTHFIMTVAKYLERAFSIKRKFCLECLLKMYDQHLFLTMAVPIKWMRYEWKSSCLKNRTEKTTVAKWNERVNF